MGKKARIARQQKQKNLAPAIVVVSATRTSTLGLCPFWVPRMSPFHVVKN